MEVEKIGVIESVKFGFGGYQNVQIVFSFHIKGLNWGTFCEYECGWGHVSEEDLLVENSHHKWTHEQRVNQIGTKAWQVIKLMKDAKVDNFLSLVGKPVRVYFESDYGKYSKFEILKEAIL